MVLFHNAQYRIISAKIPPAENKKKKWHAIMIVKAKNKYRKETTMPEIKNINNERIRKIKERMQKIDEIITPWGKENGILEQGGSLNMEAFSCMLENGKGVSELDQKRINRQFEDMDALTIMRMLRLKAERIRLEKEKLERLGKYEGSMLQKTMEIDLSKYLPRVIQGGKRN
jgi:hypothetical protein